MTEPLDLLITNAHVVHHDRSEAQRADIGVKDGTIVRGAPGIDPASATSVVDAAGKLTAWNPATRFGLRTKGAVGFDADIALVDPDVDWTVRAADSESTQEYTPFEGFSMTAAVTDTFVRGHRVLESGKVVGEPVGRYLKRRWPPTWTPRRRGCASTRARWPRTWRPSPTGRGSRAWSCRKPSPLCCPKWTWC